MFGFIATNGTTLQITQDTLYAILSHLPLKHWSTCTISDFYWKIIVFYFLLLYLLFGNYHQKESIHPLWALVALRLFYAEIQMCLKVLDLIRHVDWWCNLPLFYLHLLCHIIHSLYKVKGQPDSFPLNRPWNVLSWPWCYSLNVFHLT